MQESTVRFDYSPCLLSSVLIVTGLFRFSKRQYAPIEIVLTEMKGYGLRAATDLPS